MEENKFGIEETLDVVAYADKLVDKMSEAKADDGKIDGAEIGTALASTAPSGIKAIWGAGDVPKELADLTPEERKELTDKAVPVLVKLVKLFAPAG